MRQGKMYRMHCRSQRKNVQIHCDSTSNVMTGSCGRLKSIDSLSGILLGLTPHISHCKGDNVRSLVRHPTSIPNDSQSGRCELFAMTFLKSKNDQVLMYHILHSLCGPLFHEAGLID